MDFSPRFWKLVGVCVFIPGILVIAIMEQRENGGNVIDSLRVALRDWKYAFFE